MRLHEYGGDSISLRMYNWEREKKDTRVTNQFKLSLLLKSDATNRKKVYNIANGLTLVKDIRVLPAAVFIDKVMSMSTGKYFNQHCVNITYKFLFFRSEKWVLHWDFWIKD